MPTATAISSAAWPWLRHLLLRGGAAAAPPGAGYHAGGRHSLPEQSDGWTAAQQERYRDLLELCNYRTVVQEKYDPGCMHRRNRYMVDHSSLLLAVHDGSPGGTRYTIEYALRRRKDVLILPVPER